MSATKRRSEPSLRQWQDRPVWPLTVILGAVVVAVLAIVIPKAVSAALPAVSDSKPAVELTLGSSVDGEWSVIVTQSDGAPLPCHEISAGLMTGWECKGSEVKSHTFETPDAANNGDPAQPIRRIIRAANLGPLPEGGAVSAEGPLTILRLDQQESARVNPELDQGHTITGFLVTNPPGVEGISYVIVVDGSEEVTADVERSLSQSLGAKGMV